MGWLAAALGDPWSPEGVKGWHDITRYPEARRIPGLILFRWDAPLFFANAELFQDRVLDAVDAAPTPVRRVVVTAEPVTSVDVTSADRWPSWTKAGAAGIELCFAAMKDPVKDKLRRFGLFEQLGDSDFFPTVGTAVDAYCAAHGLEVSVLNDQ